MKSNELISNLRSIKIVLLYIIGGQEHPELSNAIDELINIRRYKYTGEMYRAISLPPNVRSFTDDQLYNYIVNHNNNVKYVSWSKTIEGMWTAIHQNERFGDYEYGSGFVIFKQNGIGLNTTNIIIDHPELDFDDTFKLMLPEQEVLSKMNNKSGIVGFVHDGDVVPTFQEFKQKFQ